MPPTNEEIAKIRERLTSLEVKVDFIHEYIKEKKARYLSNRTFTWQKIAIFISSISTMTAVIALCAKVFFGSAI